MHPVRKGDTLPGLALRYGAKVEDIKKANRLWNSNEIWMLKTLKIPTDIEQYRAAQSKLIRDKQLLQAQEFLAQARPVLQGMLAASQDGRAVPADAREAQLSEEMALDYLEKNRYALEDALAQWRGECHKQLFYYGESSQVGGSQLSSVDISQIRQRQEDHADEVFQL